MSACKRIASRGSKPGSSLADGRKLRAASLWRSLVGALLLTTIFAPPGWAYFSQHLTPDPPGIYILYGPEDFVRQQRTVFGTAP